MRPCLVGQCPGSRLGLGLQVPEAPTATDLLVDGCRSDSYMNVSCEDAASGSMCSWKHEARGLGMSVSLSPCLLLRRTRASVGRLPSPCWRLPVFRASLAWNMWVVTYLGRSNGPSDLSKSQLAIHDSPWSLFIGGSSPILLAR